MDDILESVKKALKEHDYDVSYEAPGCIEEREHPDGSVYYVVMGDDAGSGMDHGSCTVEIDIPEGVLFFTHDFINGWKFSGKGLDEDVLDAAEESADEITDMIEELEDVHIYSDIDDDETLIEIYELATGETVDEYYSYEDAPDEDEEED